LVVYCTFVGSISSSVVHFRVNAEVRDECIAINMIGINGVLL
jgi:hypothetical protein